MPRGWASARARWGCMSRDGASRLRGAFEAGGDLRRQRGSSSQRRRGRAGGRARRPAALGRGAGASGRDAGAARGGRDGAAAWRGGSWRWCLRRCWGRGSMRRAPSATTQKTGKAATAMEEAKRIQDEAPARGHRAARARRTPRRRSGRLVVTLDGRIVGRGKPARTRAGPRWRTPRSRPSRRCVPDARRLAAVAVYALCDARAVPDVRRGPSERGRASRASSTARRRVNGCCGSAIDLFLLPQPEARDRAGRSGAGVRGADVRIFPPPARKTQKAAGRRLKRKNKGLSH